MNKYLLIAFLVFCSISLTGQYVFTNQLKLPCTSIKNQENTGTCWCFATTSFIESEILRMGQAQVDISEMYLVKQIYLDKAFNYVMRQGKANFSQGGLAHDMLRAMDRSGMLPEEAYGGRINSEPYNHVELESALKGFLDGVLKSGKPSNSWILASENILDSYLGKPKTDFSYKGKNYTAKSFSTQYGINAQDYVELTSYTHHPFYTKFILEIPDNYSNGEFYNLPVDELMSTIDNALESGYTIAWDGDVSEQGFSAMLGVAVIPDSLGADISRGPIIEKSITQNTRQESFANFSTTDDHLMHLIGKAIDQKGNKYYIVKNSWGEIGPYKGNVYLSESYVRLKTVGILLHKSAMPKSISSKLAF